MKIEFEINPTNKWLYALIVIILLTFGVGVLAYNSGQSPSIFGHSAEELDVFLASHDLLDSNYQSSYVGPVLLFVNAEVQPTINYCDFSYIISIKNDNMELGKIGFASTGDVDGLGSKNQTSSGIFRFTSSGGINLNWEISEDSSSPCSINQNRLDVHLYKI